MGLSLGQMAAGAAVGAIQSSLQGATTSGLNFGSSPYYSFRWVIGDVSLPNVSYVGNQAIFAPSITANSGISTNLSAAWPSLNSKFNFTNATCSFDCLSSNKSKILLNIQYPKMFNTTASNGVITIDTVTNITEYVTGLVKWPWKVGSGGTDGVGGLAGGLISNRGPAKPPTGTTNMNNYIGSNFALSNIFGSPDYVYLVGGGDWTSWANYYWSHVDGYGYPSLPDASHIPPQYTGAVWNQRGANNVNCVTWSQMESIMGITESNRNWSTWSTLDTTGMCDSRCIDPANCGPTKLFPNAISLKGKALAYTDGGTNAWRCGGQYGLSYCLPSVEGGKQYPFTFLKDVYDCFDRLDGPSGSSKLSSFPGSCRIQITMKLVSNVNTSDTTHASGTPITLEGRTLRDQFLASTYGASYSNCELDDNGCTFRFTVTDFLDAAGKIPKIAKVLYDLQDKFVIPIDFSKLPTDLGNFATLAVLWSMDFYCLNGGVQVSIPQQQIQLYPVLGSAGFTPSTKSSDINWTAQAGNELTTAQQSEIVCQAVSGTYHPAGVQFGTCAQSAISNYSTNSYVIYQEVQRFTQQYSVVRTAAGEAITKISKLLATLRGNSVVYSLLTDAQRTALSNLTAKLPTIQDTFATASATISQLTGSLFSSNSVSNAQEAAAQACGTQTTVAQVESINDSVQAAYSEITTLFTSVKTAFTGIDIPISSGIPDISVSLQSIEQRLIDLGAGTVPLDTSAGLMNPNSVKGLTNTFPTPTTTTTNPTVAAKKSSSNTMLYAGVAIGVLLVGFLIYWFYFRKPAAAATPIPAPVAPTPILVPDPAPAPTPIYVQPTPQPQQVIYVPQPQPVVYQ
jgi:hypothetical protein